MRHQDKMKIQRRRRRKLFWLFAAAAVFALLFEEQVAVLYVLSTLAICALMIVVAFSNLEARELCTKIHVNPDNHVNPVKPTLRAKARKDHFYRIYRIRHDFT
jgi:hypothetical protein